LASDKLPADEKMQVTKLAAKAKLGAAMLERVEDIGLIDSVKADKATFINQIKMAREMGSFAFSADLLGLRTDNYLVAFQSGRNDRRYLALRQNDRQSDLYQSYNLMNEWGEPVALSSVLNTPRDENYPFVAADGITIYFGSEGMMVWVVMIFLPRGLTLRLLIICHLKMWECLLIRRTMIT